MDTNNDKKINQKQEEIKKQETKRAEDCCCNKDSCSSQNSCQDSDQECCGEHECCCNQDCDCGQDCDCEQSDCAQEFALLQEKYIRACADYENFTRRVDKEKVTWMGTAQASVFKDLLLLVDDIERALAEKQITLDQQSHEVKAWFAGFELIGKAFSKLLQQYGVEEIKQLTDFDPQLHEALVQVDSPEHKTGKIVQVLQKGYTFKGQILRPAKVSVAK